MPELMKDLLALNSKYPNLKLRINENEIVVTFPLDEDDSKFFQLAKEMMAPA